MVKRKKISSKKAKKVKAVKEKKQKLTKSRVCCTKCGDCKGVSKDRMAKLIGQFGSIEDLHTSYVCRKCRKEHNIRADGRVKPEKKKRQKSALKKDENGVSILPDWLKGSSDFGPWKTFKKPEGISQKKFNTIVLDTAKKIFK